MVASWPSAVDAPRARTLGLEADDDFESVVRRYARDFASPATSAENWFSSPSRGQCEGQS